jgi:5-methylcytosine-specific restriction endonuclease McrA
MVSVPDAAAGGGGGGGSTTSFKVMPERHLSALPTRTNNLQKQRPSPSPNPKKNRSNKSYNSKSSISDQDLADHVASLYSTRGSTTNRSGAQTAENHPSEQLDRYPALVLNADYQPISYLPLSLWNWQEAIKSVLLGKVIIVDTYDHVVIRAPQFTMRVPSVLALVDYVPRYNKNNPDNHHRAPAFTKRNVFLRDEYTCQYCRQRFSTADLSLDHVVPRCRGGTLQWTNVVTSCTGCNGRKGSQSLSELAGVMKLHREPRVPTEYELAKIAGRMLPRAVHPTWEPYLATLRRT